MLTSRLCRHEEFYQEWYIHWAEALALEHDIKSSEPDKRNIQRKAWEWCAVAEALQQRGMLQPGRTGLGFAVGTEPLVSAFAARGVSVLGTDLAVDQAASWSNSNQHAASLEALYHAQLVDREVFESNVKFEPTDMRDMSAMSGRSFDFVWSSCSFEHLGSLEAGLRFVVDAMRLVKPGGVAIHTTEYNVSSNDATLETGPSVIYRRRDIEDLAYALRSVTCALEPVEFDAGNDRQDIEFDFPPYFQNGRKHIKLLLGPYVSTSILLIIRKGTPPPTEIGRSVCNPFGWAGDDLATKIVRLEATLKETCNDLHTKIARLEVERNETRDGLNAKAARLEPGLNETRDGMYTLSHAPNRQSNDIAVEIERAQAALEELKCEFSAAESKYQYAFQRSILEKLFFRIDGRPVKPLRRLLFHISGKPRRLFRRLVLHKDGTPRKAFARWMQDQTGRARAATQPQGRSPIQAGVDAISTLPRGPSSIQAGVNAMTARERYFLARLLRK